MHIIRFIKFVEIKHFLFDNRDIYDNDEEIYFPNKFFNIDSFPLALLINLFIYNYLFAYFPCEIPSSEDSYSYSDCEFDFHLSYNSGMEDFFLLLNIPLYLIFFILAIFDILNDKMIYNIYDNLIYNWNMNPIKSINLTVIREGNTKYDFLWKNVTFIIEK